MHVITGLETGGAQTMLWKLLSRADPRRFSHEVVSLGKNGTIGDRIAALGQQVRALGMSRAAPNPLLVFKLTSWIRSSGADLVQTWMYHADLVGGLAARGARTPVIWGVRQSFLDPSIYSGRTVWVQRACAQLSAWLPGGVICCSEASRAAHRAVGYSAAKLTVIPNGFDLKGFAPDSDARRAVREELGLGDDVPLIGLVARYDPAKDHANFFRAAAQVRKNAHFVLCGEGVEDRNPELTRLRGDADLAGRVHLLGKRSDVARLQAALDVACLSSSTEGFPNAIGEAMSCGVPCAVTNCGDAAEIVGDTGRIAPSRNPAALAGAIESILALDPLTRQALGEAARLRIEQRYELGTIVRRYEDYYDEALRADGH